MKREKSEAYEDLAAAVEAVLGEETDPVLWMATLSCLIRDFMNFYWVGFYRVVPDGNLAVGPYQGTLACLRIPAGKGACGLCACRGETVIIPDVEEFSAHISCDSKSRSEIVVPVKDSYGKVRAVLDIDSVEKETFDVLDGEYLEKIADLMKRLEWD